MRKPIIIEHISLNGVIQVSAEDGEFPTDPIREKRLE